MAFRTNIVPVLQTKSASGSVATFNTALAMPLSSCNIALTATQSGSGTPSPDNVRPISGYSAINISQSGGNVWDETWTNGYYDYREGGAFVSDARFVCCLNRIEILPNTTYILDFPNYGYEIELYNKSGTYTRRATPRGKQTITTRNEYFMTFYMSSPYGRVYNNDISIEMVNVAKTISIGSTVYGGEYDARTGVLTVTHKCVDLGTLNWNRYTNSRKTYFRTANEISDCIKSTSVNKTYGLTCSNYVEGSWTNVVDGNGYDLQFTLGWDHKSYIAIHDDSKSSLSVDDFKTAMSGETLVFPLATPTTIQLPPCPIDTLEGVNNIWSDTGDIDLTYKDLDIAKRGNFREVFKLPS